jgi:hypothetical protein
MVAVMSALWFPGFASVKVAPDTTLLRVPPSVPAAVAELLPVRAASPTEAVPVMVVV